MFQQVLRYQAIHLAERLICSKCGATLKLRRVNNINYRACRNHDKDSKLCSLGRIRESEINNAFIRMFNKLQLNKK